jgi:predicted MPP superfamily phosphohydrolase
LDTSVNARIAMAVIVFGMVWIIAYENLRTACLLILRKKINRFTRLLWFIAALSVVFCVIDAFYIEPDWIQVTHHSIETNKLPSGARLRIVQLSDLHMNGFGRHEQEMINLTAARKPDIIVLTGDYLNTSGPAGHRVLTRVGQALLEIAPTYAVEGNWDGCASMKALEDCGVKKITGWDVISTRRAGKVALGHLWWSMQTAAVYIPPDIKPLYKVLLCHRPNTFDSAADKGIDLMLSGHTHGGQVRLPIFGAIMPDRELIGKYQAGKYRLGNSVLYINRGLGMESSGPHVRFCCRPEISVIDLVSGN